MKSLLQLIAFAICWTPALAQTSDSDIRDRAKGIDIKACTPSNPNCNCNPKVDTCWFKVGDMKVYFDALTRERSTIQQFNAQQ